MSNRDEPDNPDDPDGVFWDTYPDFPPFCPACDRMLSGETKPPLAMICMTCDVIYYWDVGERAVKPVARQ